MGVAHHGGDLAANGTHEQADGFLRPLVDVDMRIGVVPDDHRGEVHQVPGGVGVEVERDGDRHVRPRDLADAAEDLVIGVGVILRDHRAMQVEHDTVGRQGVADAARQLPDESLEGLAVDRAGGGGVRKKGGNQLHIVRPGAIDRAAKGVVGASVFPTFVATSDSPDGFGRVFRRKRMGLVHNAAADQSHVRCSPVWAAMSRQWLS